MIDESDVDLEEDVTKNQNPISIENDKPTNNTKKKWQLSDLCNTDEEDLPASKPIQDKKKGGGKRGGKPKRGGCAIIIIVYHQYINIFGKIQI